MTALLDTGFLLAVLDADDELHEICAIALQEEPDLLLPDMVIPELAYMSVRELGHATLSQFLRSLNKGELTIVQTTNDDLLRTAEILEKYADNKVDFVDCAIVAMSERFNVTRILTVDRRHFEIFRPKHCSTFEIAP
jgi:predicted nucleic acid-binding protein